MKTIFFSLCTLLFVLAKSNYSEASQISDQEWVFLAGIGGGSVKASKKNQTFHLINMENFPERGSFEIIEGGLRYQVDKNHTKLQKFGFKKESNSFEHIFKKGGFFRNIKDVTITIDILNKIILFGGDEIDIENILERFSQFIAEKLKKSPQNYQDFCNSFFCTYKYKLKGHFSEDHYINNIINISRMYTSFLHKKCQIFKREDWNKNFYRRIQEIQSLCQTLPQNYDVNKLSMLHSDLMLSFISLGEGNLKYFIDEIRALQFYLNKFFPIDTKNEWFQRIQKITSEEEIKSFLFTTNILYIVALYANDPLSKGTKIIPLIMQDLFKESAAEIHCCERHMTPSFGKSIFKMKNEYNNLKDKGAKLTIAFIRDLFINSNPYTHFRLASDPKNNIAKILIQVNKEIFQDKNCPFCEILLPDGQKTNTIAVVISPLLEYTYNNSIYPCPDSWFNVQPLLSMTNNQTTLLTFIQSLNKNNNSPKLPSFFSQLSPQIQDIFSKITLGDAAYMFKRYCKHITKEDLSQYRPDEIVFNTLLYSNQINLMT